MTISVIICTYNGAARLPRCLEALRAQMLSSETTPWEVLLVDNASTDNTRAVAESCVPGFPVPLRVLSEPKPGKANALHTAFGHAEGELFCIVDDDNLLDPDYLALAVDFMRQHPDAGAIGGRVVPEFEDQRCVPADFNERFAALLAIRDFGDNVIWGQHPIGAGMVGRTSLMRGIYEQIGTYLEDRVGDGFGCAEDIEKAYVIQRLGWRLAYVPSLRLRHVLPPRRMTGEYIDGLRLASRGVGPWLEVLSGRALVRGRIGCMVRALPSLTKVAKYRLLSLCPASWHPKLPRASFWAEFYRAAGRGYFALARDWLDVAALLRRIDEAPAELRPRRAADVPIRCEDHTVTGKA